VSKRMIVRYFTGTLSLLALLCLNSGLISAKVKEDKERIKIQVDSVMERLSIREKVSQLFVIEFVSRQSDDIKRYQNRLIRRKIGGVIVMDDSLAPAVERMNKFRRIAKVPLLITIDGEWGAAMRFKELPAFPKQIQLGALSSDKLIYKMGYAIGKECRNLGIHVNFAPDVDINNNPDNPAINARSFGEDREKVAMYGSAYMEGMKVAGVAGSAKHFPGHGDTNVDSHKSLPVLPFGMARLQATELYPFRFLIGKGVDIVMVGHLQVPVLDPSGAPASISQPIITGFLKEKMGFDGIVCTDALNMDGVSKMSGLPKKKIPLAAFKAGADILLMPQEVDNSIDEIVKAINSGEITEAMLDEKLRKVLSLKASLGLFSKTERHLEIDTAGLVERSVKQANIDLINKICGGTITVLTNKSCNSLFTPGKFYQPVLPLKKLKYNKVAYVGYGGDENGAAFASTLIRGGKPYNVNLFPIDTFVVSNIDVISKIELLKERLKGYDLIILGIHDTDPRPQKNFGLDESKMKFFADWAANQNMIAVYFGSPYALAKIPGIDSYKAFVIAYSNTLYNNIAAAKVIFGVLPAIGVLPVSAGKFKAGEGLQI
jgi:beta-N-acetylhexosaminidase